MSAFNQGQSPRICPRCKAILPPGEATCYSCGFQIAYVQPKSTAQPTHSPLPPITRKDRSRIHYQAAFIYFISVFLVIVLFGYLLLHSAGISLSTFLPHGAATPSTVAYPVPKGPALLSDNFLSDAYGWNLQDSTGNYAVTLGNGGLTLEIDQHNLLWEMLPGERVYSNFILPVKVGVSPGSPNDGH